MTGNKIYYHFKTLINENSSKISCNEHCFAQSERNPYETNKLVILFDKIAFISLNYFVYGFKISSLYKLSIAWS